MMKNIILNTALIIFSCCAISHTALAKNPKNAKCSLKSQAIGIRFIQPRCIFGENNNPIRLSKNLCMQNQRKGYKYQKFTKITNDACKAQCLSELSDNQKNKISPDASSKVKVIHCIYDKIEKKHR